MKSNTARIAFFSTMSILTFISGALKSNDDLLIMSTIFTVGMIILIAIEENK